MDGFTSARHQMNAELSERSMVDAGQAGRQAEHLLFTLRAAHIVYGDAVYGIGYFNGYVGLIEGHMIPIIRPPEEEADEDPEVGIEDVPDLEPIYAGDEAMEPLRLENVVLIYVDENITICHQTGECLTNIHEDKRHFVIGNNGEEVADGWITSFP